MCNSRPPIRPTSTTSLVNLEDVVKTVGEKPVPVEGPDTNNHRGSFASWLQRNSSISSTDSSLSDEGPMLKSCLKVKTQSQSLLLEEKDATSLEEEPDNDTKHVDFSEIEVQVYPIILGDNPSISSGPPLSMDWLRQGSTRMRANVKTYEKLRGERRSVEALRIPAGVRMEWLKNEGYARSEIVRATSEAMRCKRARNLSAAESSSVMKFQHGKEVVQRKLQKWLLHAPSDKILYNQWKESHGAAAMPKSCSAC